MARRGGWKREGSRGRFSYVDARGNRITDPDKLERITGLVIPPAWENVWISPSPSAKLQATGLDAAGRKQYLYHPAFRAQPARATFHVWIEFPRGFPACVKRTADPLNNSSL